MPFFGSMLNFLRPNDSCLALATFLLQESKIYIYINTDTPDMHYASKSRTHETQAFKYHEEMMTESGSINFKQMKYLSSPLSMLSISAVTSAISSFNCCKQEINK